VNYLGVDIMNKKIIIITLLAACVIGLLYYSNIALIKRESQKVQNELQTKIDKLQEDRQNLEKKVADIQNAPKEETNKNKIISLADVQVQSSEMYNEGSLNGAVYGKFNVVARVKNTSSSDISNVNVSSLFIKSPIGQKITTTEAKTQIIDKLSAGEEKEIVFTDYRVDHPEIPQEVIVNVFHNSTSDINDYTNVKKINIRTAFPPQSKD
jgi:ABC-type siderophore export system fused ATPase/permease subunit